jgi:hypothetical protein
VVWSDNTNRDDYDIFLRMSNNGGETFSPLTEILNFNIGNSLNPEIGISGDNVFVIWEDNIFDDSDRNIFYISSTDGGFNFNPVNQLSSIFIGDSFVSNMAISGNNVSVVWSDNTNGNDYDILFRMSKDAGQTFSPRTDLSNNIGNSLNPEIAIFENNIYVVWADTIDYDIHLTSSTDGGLNFSPIINLSNNNDGFSFNPQIAISK